MLSFLRRNQVLLSSFLCVLFSLYIIAPAAKGHIRADPIGPLLMAVMRPMQAAIRATVLETKGAYHRYVDRFLALRGVREENEQLKARILELEIERDRLLEAEATNRQLRELMEFRSELPAGSIAASVIGKSASTWFHSFILDRGAADGMEKGMAVVTPTGVVGQVVSVASKNAKVLLVTDPHSGVDAVVQRSRARGIVTGSVENGPILKYVKRSEDIEEGDRLITSGLDGIFPKGLLIGIVSRVSTKSSGLFQYVEVALAVEPARIEEVLVVKAGAAPGKE